MGLVRYRPLGQFPPAQAASSALALRRLGPWLASAVPVMGWCPVKGSEQHQLRHHIFGDVTGPPDPAGNPTPVYIAAFSGKRKADGSKLYGETSRFFLWPSQSAEATRWLTAESQRGREAYQCAHLV